MGDQIAGDGSEAWLALLQSQMVVVQAMEERLEAEAGVSLASFEVLLHLAAAPQGKQRMNDLAHGLVFSKSGMTRLIDRMVASEWVERASCESDRRVIYAAITESGREALARALPVHHRAVDEIFTKHLTGKDLRAVASALGKVVDGHGYSRMPCTTAADQQVDASVARSHR